MDELPVVRAAAAIPCEPELTSRLASCHGEAAAAFLKGYKDYGSNARAADSLLKLAMSLDRLGQKDGACSSYSELNTRFPDAPDNVKMRAKSERQRIGCP